VRSCNVVHALLGDSISMLLVCTRRRWLRPRPSPGPHARVAGAPNRCPRGCHPPKLVLSSTPRPESALPTDKVSSLVTSKRTAETGSITGPVPVPGRRAPCVALSRGLLIGRADW